MCEVVNFLHLGPLSPQMNHDKLELGMTTSSRIFSTVGYNADICVL